MTSLAYLVDELSVVKECCKAVVHLSTGNEKNRQAFLSTAVLDLLTCLLSSSFSASSNSYTAAGTDGGVLGLGLGSGQPLSDQTKEWAKMAMDALIGKTYA